MSVILGGWENFVSSGFLESVMKKHICYWPPGVSPKTMLVKTRSYVPNASYQKHHPWTYKSCGNPCFWIPYSYHLLPQEDSSEDSLHSDSDIGGTKKWL